MAPRAKSRTNGVRISLRALRLTTATAAGACIGWIWYQTFILSAVRREDKISVSPSGQAPLQTHAQNANRDSPDIAAYVRVREVDVNISSKFEVIRPCRPLDITAAKENIVCIPKCKPHANQTIEGLGLDANERITITTQHNKDFFRHEYGRYRIHFPEENIYLDHASQPLRLHEEMQPRAVTERLFRRIIAKLFRAGVLDPSKNIINTGSWIGDNALSWALMLEQLSENPGKVIAVDPSAKYIQYMTNIANENSISNMCTHLTVYSSKERTIFTGNTEHMGVNLSNKKGIAMKAITLSSENLENVTLLHIDVEGHESELLEGASRLIDSSRPVVRTCCCCGFHFFMLLYGQKDTILIFLSTIKIITEGVEGSGVYNDIKVAKILKALGYTKSNDIPEVCGWKLNCRNRIWWPDDATEAAAMAVVGKELGRSVVVPWISFELPE